MILHIPHSSFDIPAVHRDQFILDDQALRDEQVLLVDAYTDELFAFPEATTIRFPYSRLLVDAERFREDADEPMSKIGMGKIYERTALGEALRRELTNAERASLTKLYDEHHREFYQAVSNELESDQQSLIVDCHSFPNVPLPWTQGKDTPIPDFCVGTDEFHTPAGLSNLCVSTLEKMGYSVAINWPFAGSIVPAPYYQKENRIQSVMIEVNRRLYVEGVSTNKSGRFDDVRQSILELLEILNS